MKASEANEKSTKSLYDHVIPDQILRVLSDIEHSTTMGIFAITRDTLRYETIEKLKELGYEISGCSNYGYRISWEHPKKKSIKKRLMIRNIKKLLGFKD